MITKSTAEISPLYKVFVKVRTGKRFFNIVKIIND
jgi:hypothetical protein